MANLTINTICTACGKPIQAVYTGKYRDLLDKILEPAGHQPEDLTYSEIMEKVVFPDDK
jgi:hypothetical protein